CRDTLGSSFLPDTPAVRVATGPGVSPRSAPRGRSMSPALYQTLPVNTIPLYRMPSPAILVVTGKEVAIGRASTAAAHRGGGPAARRQPEDAPLVGGQGARAAHQAADRVSALRPRRDRALPTADARGGDGGKSGRLERPRRRSARGARNTDG